MFSDDELDQWYQRNQASDRTRQIINQVRQSDPARHVRSAAGNVSGRYPSRKMGRTIQFESHRNELAAILIYEHSPEVIEFWDQPPTIKLYYQSKSGKPLGVLHTPDFFVIRTDEAGWEECKTEEELRRLSKSSPHRYSRTDGGQWQCPPGEQHAEQWSLTYRVRSSSEINWTYQRNVLFLEDYLRDVSPSVAPHIQDHIRALAVLHPGIALAELIASAAPGTADDVHTLIVTDVLFVDLEAAPLAEPERVAVFYDKQMAASHQNAPTPSSVRPLLNPEASTLIFDLTQASPEDLAKAHHRYAIIAPELRGEVNAQPEQMSDRTKMRWIANYRAAEKEYGVGFIGLIPRTRQRGNRTQRMPDGTQALMIEFIDQQYETIKQQGKKAIFGKLVLECEKHGLVPPSYMTWCRHINQRPREHQIRKREGPRAAYQHQQFYWELELTTPRHGDRPFEIVHLDHTKLDIELVCSRTGQNLGRPWATIMTDAFSRRLLAIFLSYDAPSYRSCMMALRECIRRHERFPQSLVVDGGKEFESIYFETLLARYECTKKTRPPAQPRFGSVCERLFGTTNTQFIHNLIGNTQITKQVRQVTVSVDPARHAQWPLGKLHQWLCEWAYEVYDNIPHPALGVSPRTAFTEALAISGQRGQRRVMNDEEFRLWTLPTTRSGYANVTPGKGVKIHHIYYWSSAFRDPAVEKTQVPVRYDPYDIGTAYAYVGKRWVQCVSEYYSRLHGRSERELMLATAELRKNAQAHASQFIITAKRLAEFLISVEAEEKLFTQRLQDREGQSVLSGLPPRREVMLPSDQESHNPSESATPRATGAVTNRAELSVYEEY